jgi:uncharacterized membrane protein
MPLITKQSDPINPLPVQIYFSTVLFLTFAGIMASSYLMYSHFRVYTDISYNSFCAISKAINCDTISQSAYSIFFNVPVAVWGFVGYIFLFVVICFSLDRNNNKMKGLSTLLSIVLIFSIISLSLGIISSFYIHAYCIVCIAVWVINFALLYMFWLIRRRYETSSFFSSIRDDFLFWKKKKISLILILTFFVATGTLIQWFPKYWNYPLPDKNVKINTGVTSEGHPWIGAENPNLTIIEFSDYRCFQCKKMHHFLRNLVIENHDKLRIIHRQFPMDHKFNPLVKEPFHSGSGIFSLIAISGITKNRFWEINDYLFNYDTSSNAIYLRKIAKDLNIELTELQKNITDKQNTVKLSQDIIFGMKHKFDGTPAFVINGQVYTGQIPPEIIQSAL